MPDHTDLNFQDQFTTLIDMKLHTQNELYISLSFSDLQVLISFFGHASTCFESIM